MLKAAPLLLLLASCGGQQAPGNRDEPTPAVAPASTAKVAEPAPQVVAIDEETDLLEFHLAWPAEISAIPALATKLRSAAMTHKAELLKIGAWLGL